MNAANPLSDWPKGESVGLLIFADDTSTRLSDPNTMSLALHLARRWWSATAKNMAVGPGVEPPFRNLYFIELDDTKAATALVDELRDTEPPSTTVVAASPISTRSKRRFKWFQKLMRRLPNPDRSGGSLPPAFDGHLVPTEAQLRKLREMPPNGPVLELSLNRYRDFAADPMTGEQKNGRDVFQPYFRRTLSASSRLGAQILWMGHSRGSLMGSLDMPGWHDIMAVSYPSYDAVMRMAQNPGLQSKMRYRVAGLDASWVVMGPLVASSTG